LEIYKADDDGLPTGSRLTVKVSDTYDRLERENNNYEKVTSGLFRGQFVNKVEFFPQANGSVGSKNACALVLESGERNLRDLCNARQNVGLKGTAMRQAAVAIAQCIQAVDSSGLVWTNLKAENFVTATKSLGDKGSTEGIKGIDPESTVKAGDVPIDYSPEACPSEFAKEEAAGRGTEFRVTYNYDSWSFGILLYELAVGKSIFGKMSDGQITTLLRKEPFEPDISAVEDGRLRGLIAQGLQLDPGKRPEITQILLHPYFLTTGIGTFSF
jgi:serine/threonine protein kinase